MFIGTNKMSAQELQLNKLIQQAQRLTKNEEIESCTQWIDREISKAQKLIDQIERSQKGSEISTKAFNESRDITERLQSFIDKLRDYRTNMGKYGRQIVLNSADSAMKSDILKNASYNMEYKSPL